MKLTSDMKISQEIIIIDEIHYRLEDIMAELQRYLPPKQFRAVLSSLESYWRTKDPRYLYLIENLDLETFSQ